MNYDHLSKLLSELEEIVFDDTISDHDKLAAFDNIQDRIYQAIRNSK